MTVHVHDHETARVVRGDVEHVYRAAFTRPPYDETEDDVRAAMAHFDRRSSRPAFRAVLSRAADGAPTAMAHGHSVAATTGWWDTLTTPVDDALRREDGRRTFGLFELAVHPDHHRQGLATVVHAALLRGLPHERVLLNARPDAVAAIAAYTAWGYRAVGENIPWAGAVPHLVMVLDLRTKPQGGARRREARAP